ncbi:hypothetical protein GLOIN_2v1787529 [Rhizophagus irregularis DAOM 181602=DAOM 197198]|uniref:Uncharacterized protein n=1 Tax=Rhizophagus irregularis (strain DAOM 181602 / DAOM 197198 / MUCL 43194) TaxID=747089 RepID=A0A2P4P5S2_RHIID|nr:hypothetical protein GLOIN_2v1787529 [Rhizophagus irregularis DAOM 181602=DAOM 197198]POG60707.1 hypothetical protein GLOIN_2v1787529 [Rhizophagus irregularis DAOM 181602=DAOM 197198]GBC31282.2 hypothetical protein GLOIN_2v1787529 [Rhizophagus irregularis DAOM 181602=DAOM 197198]|eukprot:XP_025167573.1 hypothetical protein GLOIN_2v1787529 [Rhizophagus irregularis DAOM 181602=DAOM 197198]
MTLMVYKYNAEEITKIYEKRYILKQKIYKLFVSQCKNIEELSWNDSQPLSFFPRTSRLNSLINAERNLKEVLIYNNRKFDCKELIKALEKNDTITKLLLSSKANNAGILIKAIAKHCPKVEELTTYRGPKDFIHVKSLLLNNCRNLSSIVLNSLIQV